MKRIVFVFFSFLLLTFTDCTLSGLENSKSLNSFIYDCYNSSRGMPENNAAAFAQNSQKFVYIASQEGVVKFDGTEMDIFDKKTLKGLPSNLIRDIVVDNQDNVYIATNKGLSLFSKDGTLIDSFFGPEGINYLDISSIAMNKKTGTVFGAVPGKGIFLISNEKTVLFFTKENGLIETKNVIKVFSTDFNSVIVTAREGLYYLDNKKFVKIPGTDDSFSSLTETPEGDIWAGGEKGLYKIKGNKIEEIYTAERGLPVKNISSLFYDSAGTLWIASSYKGLARFIKGQFDYIENTGTIDLRNILSLFEDSEKNIWIGTEVDGFCLVKSGDISKSALKDHIILGISEDTKGNLWANSVGYGAIKVFPDSSFTIINKKIGTNLLSVYGDKTGKIWVSSRGNGLFISTDGTEFSEIEKTFASSKKIYPASASVIFEDSKGIIWCNDRDKPSSLFAFSDNKITVYKLPSENVIISDIIQNKKGDVIVGTKENGIFRFDALSGRFVEINIYKEKFFVHNLLFDSRERLWISTQTDGIYIFIDGDIIKLNSEKGLFNENVHSMLEDKLGNFWFTTNRGLFTIKSESIECFISGDCQTVNSIVFNESDGMPSSECNGGVKPSAIIASDESIWAPTIRGIVNVDPMFKSNNVPIPQISLKWLVLDNDFENKIRIKDNSEIGLPPHTKNVEIHFSSPVFNKSGQLLYEYSLNGGNINKNTKRKFATFNNLDSGKYVFKVKAYFSGGKTMTSSEKEIRFNITPLFYETNAFKRTAIILFIILVFVIFMMNRVVVSKKEDEMLRVINEKTYELKLKNNELNETIMIDPLTQLRNRRFLFEVEENNILNFVQSKERKTHLVEGRKSTSTQDTVYAIIMLDIDHFKRINDLHGHNTGDIALKDFSFILKDSVRNDDIVIRWGGEEFVIILKNITKENAIKIAEKIRKNVDRFEFHTEDEKPLWITASLGISFIPFFKHAPNLFSFENVISITDIALYHSKNKGRNMCTVVRNGSNIPSSHEQLQGMLASSQYAELNGFYTLETVVSNNFEEFEI